MLYYLDNARSQEQYDDMVRLEAAGTCIFCLEHLGLPGGKEILASNTTWSIVNNDFPYEGTLTQVLLIPVQHVNRMSELWTAARADYWDIIEQAEALYGQSHYVLGSRHGDPAFTGATILHLHVQFIVGDPNNEGEPVRLYVSSRPSDNGSPFAH